MKKQEWIRDLILEVQEWKLTAQEYMKKYSELLNDRADDRQESYDLGFRDGSSSNPEVNRTFIMGGSGHDSKIL